MGDFLKLCAADHDSRICLNSPFISKPAVNLKPLDHKINDIAVFPVGDSLFTGNPKVGNGLMNHLSHIAELVRTIENDVENKKGFEVVCDQAKSNGAREDAFHQTEKGLTSVPSKKLNKRDPSQEELNVLLKLFNQKFQHK